MARGWQSERQRSQSHKVSPDASLAAVCAIGSSEQNPAPVTPLPHSIKPYRTTFDSPQSWPSLDALWRNRKLGKSTLRVNVLIRTWQFESCRVRQLIELKRVRRIPLHR